MNIPISINYYHQPICQQERSTLKFYSTNQPHKDCCILRCFVRVNINGIVAGYLIQFLVFLIEAISWFKQSEIVFRKGQCVAVGSDRRSCILIARTFRLINLLLEIGCCDSFITFFKRQNESQ